MTAIPLAMFAAGAGVGPWRLKDLTYLAGYTYRQYWITNGDRLKEWLDDPADLPYFPLRSDLLERHHQFYLDLRDDLGDRVVLSRTRVSRIVDADSRTIGPAGMGFRVLVERE